VVFQLSNDADIINEIYRAVDRRSLGETSILFDSLLTQKPEKSNRDVNSFALKFNSLLRQQNNNKSATDASVVQFYTELTENHVQIYWPYHDEWDGQTCPTVSFYDGINEFAKTGYRFRGTNIDTVLVTDDYAWENPVWIINNYDGNPADYLAQLKQLEQERINDYYAQTTLKTGNNSHNHVSVKITDIRCKNDISDYEGVFGGNLELRWARGHLVNWNNSATHMKMQNNVVSYNFDRKRARKGWWTSVNSHWITDWSKSDPSFMMGVFEQDQGSWKAAGNGTVKRTKTVTQNITVSADLNVELADIKITQMSNTQTAYEVNGNFSWSIESKEGILGSMEWSRSWVCQNFIGTETTESYSGIECKFVVSSWN